LFVLVVRKMGLALAGPDGDHKLVKLAEIISELLRDGFHPIVFCRFIPTAQYLAEWLPKLLLKEFGEVHASAVTGEIGDDERREKVEELSGSQLRILVATDCLSEGIDLQEHFDSVVH